MAIKFVGNCEFEECCQPFGSKDEWGLDVLQRKFRGRADKLSAFMGGLRQGAAFNGFALQTWYSDDNPVFPTVLLTYKGLLSGNLPDPFISDSTSERSGTKTTEVSGEERTYDYTYSSPQRTYRFIKNTLEPVADPVFSVASATVIQSWYVGPDGVRKSGYPPSVSPIGQVVSRSSTPVFGTPYREVEVIIAGILTP